MHLNVQVCASLQEVGKNAIPRNGGTFSLNFPLKTHIRGGIFQKGKAFKNGVVAPGRMGQFGGALQGPL